jgi:hypothetical protein
MNPTLFLMLALAVPGAAHAASLRCGPQKLVSDGASLETVRSICGEPHSVSVRSVWAPAPCCGRAAGQRFLLHVTETWTYNFGPGTLIQVVVFVDDRLVDVTSGGFGS